MIDLCDQRYVIIKIYLFISYLCIWLDLIFEVLYEVILIVFYYF